MTPFTVRPTSEDDWQQVRTLRLEMLADTPIAFGEHLAQAEQLGELTWRQRGARGTSPVSCSFAAVADDGRWVGTMGGYLENGSPMLVGVYVSPDHRGGTGVADALLAAVEHWARLRNSRLYLHVHSENARARAYYARRGFAETGLTLPYVLDTSAIEVEMVKPL